MNVRSLAFQCLLFFLVINFLPSVNAAPQNKTLNTNLFHKNKSLRPKKQTLNTVFGRKAHGQTAVSMARGIILEAGFNNEDIKWFIEQQGEGFIDLRWDYDKSWIVVRIDFDEEHLQINHRFSNKDYKCYRLDNGICYAAGNSYYKVLQRLSSSLDKFIQAQQTGRSQ